MSNEPLTTLSATQPSTPDPSTDAAPTDRAADVAMMLAAVERMETVMRGERAAFERLRADLGDMASTVALAKAALASFAIKPDDAGDGKATGKSGDVTALLQAIENRIGAMAQVIDGANVDAGSDSVVTPPPAAAVEPAVVEEPRAVAAAEVAPSVAMLESMTETLAIAMPEFEPPPPQLEAPVADDAAPVEASAPPAIDPAMPDIDLMASFAQVEAMPILRGEIGTAVIFAPKEPEAEAKAPEVPPEPEAEPKVEVEAEVAAAPEPQPEAAIEPPRDVAPVIIAEPPIEALVEMSPETSDDEDPAEFLYEPDPDPAADLLEPIDFAPQPKPTPPASAAILPTLAPAVSATVVPSPAPSPTKPMLSPEQKPASRPPAAPAVPHDPLAPLKSMSDEEKIALFS